MAATRIEYSKAFALERTKKFGSEKVCLGSSFAEHNRMSKKDQGGSYPKGEGGGVGASFRGGIEAKKFVHATTIYMEGQFC